MTYCVYVCKNKLRPIILQIFDAIFTKINKILLSLPTIEFASETPEMITKVLKKKCVFTRFYDFDITNMPFAQNGEKINKGLMYKLFSKHSFEALLLSNYSIVRFVGNEIEKSSDTNIKKSACVKDEPKRIIGISNIKTKLSDVFHQRDVKEILESLSEHGFKQCNSMKGVLYMSFTCILFNMIEVVL